MKITLLKPADMKRMPWKNGMGATAEVAISPATAQLEKLNFDWRVSIATVSADCQFSRFPGFDRQLVIWKGEGLRINTVLRRKFEPFGFSGSDEISAALNTGEVKDFGIIFRANRFMSEVTIHQLGDTEFSSHSVDGEGFFLCAQGEIRIDEFYVNPGDVVRVTGSAEVRVTALEASTFIFAKLKSISGGEPT